MFARGGGSGASEEDYGGFLPLCKIDCFIYQCTCVWHGSFIMCSTPEGYAALLPSPGQWVLASLDWRRATDCLGQSGSVPGFPSRTSVVPPVYCSVFSFFPNSQNLSSLLVFLKWHIYSIFYNYSQITTVWNFNNNPKVSVKEKHTSKIHIHHLYLFFSAKTYTVHDVSYP